MQWGEAWLARTAVSGAARLPRVSAPYRAPGTIGSSGLVLRAPGGRPRGVAINSPDVGGSRQEQVGVGRSRQR